MLTRSQLQVLPPIRCHMGVHTLVRPNFRSSSTDLHPKCSPTRLRECSLPEDSRTGTKRPRWEEPRSPREVPAIPRKCPFWEGIREEQEVGSKPPSPVQSIDNNYSSNRDSSRDKEHNSDSHRILRHSLQVGNCFDRVCMCIEGLTLTSGLVIDSEF